jgi:plastocyanin
MQRLVRGALAMAMTLALAACGSSASPSPAASTGGVPASVGAGGASSAAACAVAGADATPTVNVSIKDFAFSPEPVTAKVGDIVSWTNNDTAGHTASLVDGTCTTDTIGSGQSLALVFSAPGTYPYQCNIHPSRMKGTITVS